MNPRTFIAFIVQGSMYIPALLSCLYLFVIYPNHKNLSRTHIHADQHNLITGHSQFSSNHNMAIEREGDSIEVGVGSEGEQMEGGFTTNAADQAAVAELRRKIAESNAAEGVDDPGQQRRPKDWQGVPNISIASGQHKYVLISATEPYPDNTNDEEDDTCYTQFFVTSKRGAAYHRNAAEPYVELLQSKGYKNIVVTGGGRILFDEVDRKIHIYGFSYGFGLADHSRSMEVVKNDERYKDYEVTWSNDGY